MFWYAVESSDKKLSTMDLRTLQDWNVRLVLRTAAGVDDVTSWGGDEKQFQVLIQPQKLIKYGLTLKSVMEALAADALVAFTPAAGLLEAEVLEGVTKLAALRPRAAKAEGGATGS